MTHVWLAQYGNIYEGAYDEEIFASAYLANQWMDGQRKRFNDSVQMFFRVELKEIRGSNV